MSKEDEKKRSAQGTEVSLDTIRDMLSAAVREKFGADEPGAWVREVYPSYVIYEKENEDRCYKVAYSILEGAVALGQDAVEVQRTWVETRSQQAESDEGVEMLMRLGEAKNPEGTMWDVTICESGFTKNGWYIPDDAVRDAAGLFENVDVNLYEMPQGATHLPDPLFDLKSLLVKNKVGWIDTVKHVAGKGLQGMLHFVDSAKWLGKNLLSSMQNGKAVYGLSYDCPVRATKDEIEGRPVFKVVKFLAADSVDIVTRPAAGGKFNRAVAAMPPARDEKETIMKKKLWDLVHEKRPALLVGKEFDKTTDAEMEGLARMAMDPEKPADKGADSTATKDDLAALRCEMALKEKLAGSNLPEPAKTRIQTALSGKVFTTEELDRAIAAEKDYVALFIGTPAVESVPASSIVVGRGSYERACMAVDRLFGLSAEQVTALAKLNRLDNQPFFEDVRSIQDLSDYDKIPSFSGLREMYAFFTGDHEVSGQFNRKKLPPELRNRMDITSATFSYVLGNTLGRRLVSGYKNFKFHEEILISYKKPVKDLRQQEAVLIGGFGDLPDVNTETADYAELAGVTDEEATYTVGKKGGLLTVSDTVVINDDIRALQVMVDKLSRSAARTHAKYVWNKYINNENCSDGTAWFTGGHGNLGSTALSHTTALVAYLALAAMTEKDSGEPIGLLDDPDVKPFLIGTMGLMATILKIANEDIYFPSNDLTTKIPNPLVGKVIPVPFSLLTDANDWGLIMPASVCDIVEMGYLNGREEPELFLADGPLSERVFLGDAIRYKIRHRYAGALVDFRSGYKAVVA